jgi:hypothetical protein
MAWMARFCIETYYSDAPSRLVALYIYFSRRYNNLTHLVE